MEVERLDVTAHGVRLNASYRASTASRVPAPPLIDFTGLTRVVGLPGLTVAADGPDRVRITADPGLVSGTATARVTRADHGGIRIAVIAAGGILAAALGPLGDITLPLPPMPLGMTIQGRQRHRPGCSPAPRRPGRELQRLTRPRRVDHVGSGVGGSTSAPPPRPGWHLTP